MPLHRDEQDFDDSEDSDFDEDEIDEGPSEDEIDDDGEGPTLACPECGAGVYEDAQRCPHCGSWIVPSAGGGRRSSWVLVAGTALLAALGLWIWTQLRA